MLYRSIPRRSSSPCRYQDNSLHRASHSDDLIKEIDYDVVNIAFFLIIRKLQSLQFSTLILLVSKNAKRRI